MISRTQIRYMANSSSYSRGAELYAAGKVLDMDVKNMGASDEIVASVKGSGRNIYEVDVSIDTENDEIDTCYCECRAYAEYGGLCKHCVAVLLQYNDYENDRDSYDYGQSVEKIVNGGAFGEKFQNMDEFKEENNFKRCLKKIDLFNVIAAVDRARKIMQRNQDNGYTLYQYKGYQYYKENPSLTAWEAIEKILKDCELIV